MIVFLSILHQLEFYLVLNRKENCHHDHIPFNVKGNRIRVFSVWRLLASREPLKTFKDHSTMVSQGSRGAFNSASIISDHRILFNLNKNWIVNTRFRLTKTEYQINQKSVITIRFWFRFTIFRKYFPVCIY